jgi:hypothetical protein
MKIRLNKKPRKFTVGIKKITLKDFGKIYLNNDEQLTFLKEKSEYDIVKKSWGYYATPSVNKRLKKFNFRTFLTKNTTKLIFIMLVHKEKMREFKTYLKDEKIKIIKEITHGYHKHD